MVRKILSFKVYLSTTQAKQIINYYDMNIIMNIKQVRDKSNVDDKMAVNGYIQSIIVTNIE